MLSPKPIRVFIDSDVIISSLISTSGAAFTLLHNTSGVELCVSTLSVLELERVADRLHISSDKLREIINGRLTITEVGINYKEAREQFAEYTRDADDAHIVAGAKKSKAAFLVSYNVRHFDAEKLAQDFEITLLTPGLFLQYLRSL